MKFILYNGKIYRGQGRFCEALLIDGDRIIEVGSNEELLARSIDQRFDLQGRVVLPGFNDSHMHLYSLGKRLHQLDLKPFVSVEELIQQSKRWIADHDWDPQLFLEARGWNQDLLAEKRMLQRTDLDRISEDIPLYFVRVCGHIACLNSKALQLAGIDRHTPDPPGGVIARDETGEPTGILQETALELGERMLPRSDERILLEHYQRAMRHVLAHGVTTVQANDMQSPKHYKLAKALSSLYQKDHPAPRFIHQFTCANTKELEDYLDFFQDYAEEDKLLIGPVKLFRDGSLGGRTALLSRDYQDAPGQRGVEQVPLAKLREIVRLADREGFQVITHVIGDQAARDMLDLYEEIMEEGNPKRHGLVHLQITDAGILKRVRDLQISVFFQPIFLDYDLHIVRERVGDLADSSYAFASLYRRGVMTGFGTDAPIETIRPFYGIYCAMTRRDVKGFPKEAYRPEEAMTLEEALDCYSYQSARLAFLEEDLGLLEAGYLADLIVIDRDIFQCTPEEIRDTQVLQTMVGGQFLKI